MPTFLSDEEWRTLSANLREPFAPDDIDFRPGATTKDGKKALALAYVTSRAVQDRLDRLVGAQNWSFSYTPLSITGDVLKLAKGVLVIYGVSREDIGEASRTSPSLGCVSHSFKRVAVQFGMGRDLYDLPQEWVELDEHSRFSAATIRKLRAALPRPKTHSTPAAQDPAPATDEDMAEVSATLETMADEADEATRQHLATFDRQPPAAPSAPASPSSAGPDLDRMGFISALSGLGINPKEAMDRLGVKSLSGLNLREALATLNGSASAAPTVASAPSVAPDPAPEATPEPVEDEPRHDAVPEAFRATGEPDMAFADFLAKCAKILNTRDPKRIMAELGVKSLSGVQYSLALAWLEAKVHGSGPAPKRPTAGSTKAQPSRTEPGGGANGRAALRRLAVEAGIPEDEYLPTYHGLYGENYDHATEMAWVAFLEARKAARSAPPTPTPDLASMPVHSAA